MNLFQKELRNLFLSNNYWMELPIQTGRLFEKGIEEIVSVKQLLEGATDPAIPPNREESSKNSIFFFIIPKSIGRFVLDVFGRDKATDVTAVILGYILVLTALAIAFGILSLGCNYKFV